MAICSGSLLGWPQCGMRCRVRPHGHWGRSHLAEAGQLCSVYACHDKDRSVSAAWVGEYGERYRRVSGAGTCEEGRVEMGENPAPPCAVGPQCPGATAWWCGYACPEPSQVVRASLLD